MSFRNTDRKYCYRHSVRGSAVCAFTLSSINAALKGPFRRAESDGTGTSEIVRGPPSSASPTSCQDRKGTSMNNFRKTILQNWAKTINNFQKLGFNFRTVVSDKLFRYLRFYSWYIYAFRQSFMIILKWQPMLFLMLFWIAVSLYYSGEVCNCKLHTSKVRHLRH